MRDVLRADRLLGEAALEGRAQRRIAVRLQQLVQALHFGNPCARPAMGELGQIGERGGAEINQMLTLQVAASAFAGHRRDALGAMLGQDRAGAGLDLPRVLGAEPTGDDAHAVPIEIQRARQADRIGWHRVRMALVHHHACRRDADRNPQRQVGRRDLQRPQARRDPRRSARLAARPSPVMGWWYSPPSATRAIAARDPCGR